MNAPSNQALLGYIFSDIIEDATYFDDIYFQAYGFNPNLTLIMEAFFNAWFQRMPTVFKHMQPQDSLRWSSCGKASATVAPHKPRT